VSSVSDDDSIGSKNCPSEVFIGVEGEEMAQTESGEKTDRKQNRAK